ncbi:MAG: ATP-binding cassette domain-containing protein [Kofleriaceae bacterium]
MPLFASIDLHLRGSIGIVGENGAGKSTLVKLITGELAPSAGRVLIEPRDALIIACPQGLDEIPDGAHALAGRWPALLGLEPDQLDRWPTLSPGERRRWQFGCALDRDPDVLILDEPTNHVDVACRARVIDALRRFRGTLLVVSHDRELLDGVTEQTLRVHGGGAQLYAGSYAVAKPQWEAERAHAIDLRHAAQREADRAQRHLVRARDDQRATEAQKSGAKRKKGPKDHDQTTITRTTKIAWAEAGAGRRVEVARRAADAALAAVPELENIEQLGRSIFVDYEKCPRKFVLELDVPEVWPALDRVRVAVKPNDRIRVAGDNGAGKTTLLRALLEHSDVADRILYLPQELPADLDLVREVKQLRPDVRGRVLSLLAALGVDPDRVLASPSPSPGEARKLALALGLGRQVWAVILDEPTNHLDLPSIERLEAALAAYPGAVVVTSHDGAFAERITTTTWTVADRLVS